ncbi:hypothetical protein I6A82_06930 [Novosphingopyxis sp. YJ-S2-01]|nr:hypothetical protein [Novosphingopyxis sp. YJ-S2-01]
MTSGRLSERPISGFAPVSGDTASIRIHNTKTGKIIVSELPLEGGAAVTSGDFAIEGVAPIRLRFTAQNQKNRKRVRRRRIESSVHEQLCHRIHQGIRVEAIVPV